ncbi:hypothetical protein GGR57DRAFT_509183 [Xylariaceae sp. FL1272]|nr:hypothetical protein GGR57DRAFT_509183 [Xylariaceae sp. FL1272]
MTDYDNEAPTGRIADDSYVSQSARRGPAPVVADDEGIDNPIDARTADTDEQLERDENEAIDESNILDERTRGATQPKGTYREPGDEEGLPTDDGTSSTDLQ